MRILQSEVNDEELQNYSNEMKILVKQMLEKNPDLRPTSKDILSNKIFSQKILFVFTHKQVFHNLF
jgi:hypothetical protein